MSQRAAVTAEFKAARIARAAIEEFRRDETNPECDEVDHRMVEAVRWRLAHPRAPLAGGVEGALFAAIVLTLFSDG